MRINAMAFLNDPGTVAFCRQRGGMGLGANVLEAIESWKSLEIHKNR